jgi:hypothetical protein
VTAYGAPYSLDSFGGCRLSNPKTVAQAWLLDPVFASI